MQDLQKQKYSVANMTEQVVNFKVTELCLCEWWRRSNGENVTQILFISTIPHLQNHKCALEKTNEDRDREKGKGATE